MSKDPDLWASIVYSFVGLALIGASMYFTLVEDFKTGLLALICGLLLLDMSEHYRIIRLEKREKA